MLFSIKLIFHEKEILTFTLLQWASLVLCFLLWYQIFNWMPELLQESTYHQKHSGKILSVFSIWSLFCFTLLALLLGIFNSCIGAAFFLHKEGKDSTIASCLNIVLRNFLSIWAFSWIVGIIKVFYWVIKILNRKRRSVGIAGGAVLYTLKLSTMGILPNLIAGHNLKDSAVNSVALIKGKIGDLFKLSIGNSFFSFIISIIIYALSIYGFTKFPGAILENNDFDKTILLYWAVITVLFDFAIQRIFVHPIYVISLCSIYSDFLQEKGKHISFPKSPSKTTSNIVAIITLLVLLGTIALLFYKFLQ